MAYSPTRWEAPIETAFNSDFSLDSATGEITVKPTATIDYEARPSYSVTITATNTFGATDTIEAMIDVTNADDAGVVTLAPDPPWLGAALTASLADQDGSVSGQSWSWSRGPAAGGPFTAIAGETSSSYSPAREDVGKYLRATVSYTDAFGPRAVASGTTSGATLARPPEYAGIRPAADVTDGAGGYTELDGARGITTHTIGSSHYALVASLR